MLGLDSGSQGSTPAPAPTLRFPVYLLPSLNIPFRRRQSSTLSTNGASPPKESSIPSLSSSPTDSVLSSSLGNPETPSIIPSRFSFSRNSRRASVEPLDLPRISRSQPDILRCSTCSTDLAFSSQIVSKGFTGRHGRAYLVSPPEQLTTGRKAADLINIRVGKPETRALVTGSHIVADISCAICHAKIGWKYVDAKPDLQKYKVGKFILETQRVMDYKSWEDVEISDSHDLSMEPRDLAAMEGDEPILFDSDDEDECEDVFSGTWDPELAAKRRSRKVNTRAKQTAA
ncbi:yippee zinc-binding/DNA-binding /Mis18, centromere assembly-domain-containing protein [Pseudomassariella vexata]|uniref:Yippee zinc-binding/DNA-binding /Mis18, centromere assembly-domain-containing protein n=1 Tax=Pseudomassariella vexata TaxID=1141098 RepID=A0A1Y2E071_9PEZI|nr:yippee zinc-binding/DNA-binding /Mis18, centromere assembly-domain-containing protein [Pseudomassariella vexata]ORY64931.1 yippee zinc-binding/DNA-binding /Mis18, centromere assembly-domain-containing protein [Pseudomassariella vexata]